MVIMADPLRLLRQYTIHELEILEHDDEIIFGELSWPKNVKTNYLMWRPSHEGSIKEYYTLEALLFLLKNIDLPHALYVKRAATGNIPAVRRPDRKDLLAFLKGETTTCASIDKSVPLEIPIQVKRTHDNEVCESEPKRPRMEDVQRVRQQLITRFEASNRHDEVSVSVAKRPRFGDAHAQRVRQQLVARFESCDRDNDGNESVAKRSRFEGINVERVRKQLATRFDATEEDSVTVDNIMSLSEVMSVEKIAAIKSKRLVKKRTTIISNDSGTVVGSDGGAVLDYDVIISREKQSRTRTTLLQSSGKVLADCVLGLLQSIQLREEGESVVLEVPTSLPTAAIPVRRVPYSRYDQERFIKRDTEGFNIDTMGSYQGMILKSVVEGSSARHIVRNVRDPRLMPRMPVQGTQPPRTPIIIIPAAPTSLISMLNVKDVLEDHRFVSIEQKKAQGAVHENEVLIQRRTVDGNTNITVPYRVVNNPARLSAAEWECVVAAFVLGPSWQFKGWPMEGKPVEIFSKICPFHLKFDEMKLDVRVSRWATTVLQLSRTSRHGDRAVLRGFWDTLDRHMMNKKPHLRF